MKNTLQPYFTVCAVPSQKSQGNLSRGVRLLQDNVPVHTALIAKVAVRDSVIQEIAHPGFQLLEHVCTIENGWFQYVFCGEFLCP
ncbi:hypothetical protein J6590_064428 [Homalodisca vitripennis]|nr:hypothetical protein J6590_064428 [Homalodisca vitripennis]